MNTADPYAYWRAKLAGQDPEPPKDRTELPCGFWRTRMNEPLAVWMEDGKRTARIGLGAMYRDVPAERMASMAEQGGFGVAITEKLYRAVANGANWPDMDRTVAAQIAPSAGHNNPPQDEAEILKEQIESAKAGAGDYTKITDDDALSRAQSLRSRLTELAGKADKRRETEKKPHWDAAKAVDTKWQPIVKMAKEAAEGITRAMNAFLTEKRRREQEEQRKAEEARRRAEAEAAEKDIALAHIAPPPPPEPPKAAPTQIRGAYGRAVTPKAVHVVTEVTDWNALFLYFREHQDLQDMLRKKAQLAVNAGQAVPGVTVDEQMRVA